MTRTTPPSSQPTSTKTTRRSLFLRGLVTLLPAIVTMMIFAAGIDFVRRYVTQPINATIYWSLEGNALGWKALDRMGIDPTAPEYLDAEALPPVLADMRQALGKSNEDFQHDLATYRAEHMTFFRHFKELAIDQPRLRRAVSDVVHPIIGVLASLLLLLLIGYVASGFVGRQLIAGVDRTLHGIPIVRSVYPYTKQLVDFFLSDSSLEFESVVAVQYPSEGLWSIGLVTGDGLRSIERRTGERMISCFMPTSPMPMTGYTIFVPATRVVPLPISVDEALRVTISGGVLVPPVEKVEEIEGRLANLGAELEETPSLTHRPSKEDTQKERAG